MTSIVYYPRFDDLDLLQQQIARACWYLSPLSPANVRIETALMPERFVPSGYTPEVEAYAELLPAWLILDATPIDQQDLNAADIIVLWQGIEPLGADAVARLRKRGVAVYDVDYRDRTEGSRYVDISHRFPANDAAVVKASNERFAVMAEELKTRESAFLFCSGPEVSRYANYRFEDGINVVCNSVINDEELLAAAPPHIQIFGDPIFHFGCSNYAHEFRKTLASTQAQYGYRCMVPIKYFNLFTYWQPQFAEVSMAVPFDVNMPINLDLRNDFRLHTTDNILTFLMLPVASTLARNIYLLGCDGRPLSQNDYFWKHNEKTQFVGQMTNIQEVHPSFFKLDYDEYYLRHCDNTLAYFESGERIGRRYLALTPSYIPALNEREHPFARFAASEPVTLGLEPLSNGQDLATAQASYGVSGDVQILTSRALSGSVAGSGTHPVLSREVTEGELQWLADQCRLWRGDMRIRSANAPQDLADKLNAAFVGICSDIEVRTALEPSAPTRAPSSTTARNGTGAVPSNSPLSQRIAMTDLAYQVGKQRIEQLTVAHRIRKDLQHEITALRERNTLLEEHNASLLAEQQRHEAQLTQLHASIQSLSEEHKRLQDQVGMLTERERSLAQSHQALDARQLEAEKITSAHSRYLSSIERFRSNEPDYQVFPRHLTKEDLQAFSHEAKENFGLDLEPRSIAYMAHRIRQIESNSIGRLATSIHAALARAMALISLQDENLQYVEIGVLFGINTAIVWDLFRYKFQSTKITCIDPLEGYYDAAALDKLTGLPINETVLMQNLNRALCDMRQVTILKGLSEDAAILAEASKRRYNYLLIDGDHSYDGVRRDFENYSPLVTPGGIVVIDDYGAPEWPEVTAYADQFLMDRPDYDVLSKQHRTLILRKH